MAMLSATTALGDSVGDDPNAEALRKRIAELESRVAELKATRIPDNWLTEQRADEIRALVHDVLADADTRASLLQSGMTAGWDKGFFLASSDGNFKLKVAGQIQFRWPQGWIVPDIQH